jgi:hypothetical protein
VPALVEFGILAASEIICLKATAAVRRYQQFHASSGAWRCAARADPPRMRVSERHACGVKPAKRLGNW